MKKIEISRFWYYSIIALIIIVSYFHFSVLYYPFLDTTSAITILMTPGFSIPGDLYFWGQSFYGSLIPFLAQLLCITYRFPPAMAVAVVQYIILTAGFLALSTLFKSRFFRLLLCLLWFFPSWHSIGHLTSVIGIQMSLFVIGIYLINRFRSAYLQGTKLLWLSAACIAFIGSIWISDLSFISLILLILFLLIGTREFELFSSPLKALKEKSMHLTLLTILFWILAGIGFLWYAKSHASKIISLYHPLLNSPSEMLVSVKMLLLSFFHLLIFASGNVIESIYAWLSLITLPWIVVTSKLNNQPGDPLLKGKWFFFFGLNFIVLLFCLLASHWVSANGSDRRYFSIVWISLWITVLLFSEVSVTSNPSLRKKILLILIFIGSVSSIFPLYIPVNVPSRNTVLGEFKSLETAGIIGASSSVYLSSCVDPNHIKATPHDKEYIRNFNLVNDVFKQNRLYLMKDEWLKSFPDTIDQFGFLLQRRGEPFHKAGYELCRYEKIINRKSYGISDMKYQGHLVEDTNAYSRQVAMITPDFDRSKHFIYGPFINLAKGKYTVLFRLMTNRDLSIDNVAVLDISANFGKEILASRTIRLCDFARNHHLEEFDVPFETTKDYEGVEFRVMFLGGVNLSFDRVVLLER